MKVESAVDELLDWIQSRKKHKSHLMIGIDGRCAAGKTTLAKRLAQEISCSYNVIPMDSFFLQMHQRTKERLSEPGGNIDYERVLEEVITPGIKREAFSYRPYDCKKQRLMDKVQMEQSVVTIIEGSYSCHPYFGDPYDLSIFLDIPKEEQKERIRRRNPEEYETFISRWIPMEEKYFNEFKIKDKCDTSFVLNEGRNGGNV
ncbi:uridine kinase family protein [Aequitasia blattaphilus]|uniref:Deoxynucleoside kinase n=1 Tax=Aequitasia blattaphilus TaxID=2949332 RepID=A0ABT1EC21_9FIRM|nr:AAA family ATPase [Aequitasia blattaphilus]MCP1103385.1 deoxynucleoside kinase [Aequitasia blattaphilus]MCR8616025.1 deoxynucleoside kinase [Aequitasia blattaphilus]